MTQYIKSERGAGGRLTLTLSRPELRNALNDELIDGLAAAVVAAGDDDATRVIVLAGEGKAFCAGADLNWMRKQVTSSLEENKRDAKRLVGLLDAIVESPRPVIARVQGAALGGGMGLVAACDLVVAEPSAKFGLTEVRLGLAPAMIFPYLLRRVLRHELLALGLSGERFDARRGQAIGLVTEVAEDLDAGVDRWVNTLALGGPQALAKVKQLFNRVPALGREAAVDFTVETIAELRRGPEGQEGMAAFLQKRAASWVPTVPDAGDETEGKGDAR